MPALVNDPSKYYNRPAFLVSPPECALPPIRSSDSAADIFGKRDGTKLVQDASPDDSDLPKGGQVGAMMHNTPFARQTHNSAPCLKTVDAAHIGLGTYSYGDACDPFPDPPTLADIQRMEPDLSPASMRRRASDVDDRPSPKMLMRVMDQARGEDDQFSDISMSPPDSSNGTYYCDRLIVEETSPIVFATVADTQSSTNHYVPVETDHGEEFLPLSDSEEMRFQEAQGAYEGVSFFDGDSPSEIAFAAQASVPRSLSNVDAMTRRALSGWLTNFLFDVVMVGVLPDEMSAERILVYRNMPAFVIAEERVHHILSAMTFPRSAIILALWYICRLGVSYSPQAFPDDPRRAHLQRVLFENGWPIEERVIRSFVLGLMLADKWVDDNTFAVKTWAEVTGMSLKTLNRLQNAALQVLDYSLRISRKEWADWLANIDLFHSSLTVGCFSNDYQPFLIGEIMGDIFMATYSPKFEPQFLALLPGTSEYTDGSQAEEVWAPIVSAPEHPDLPDPSEWSPEKDPVVPKQQPRTIGSAPGGYQVGNYNAAYDVFASVMTDPWPQQCHAWSAPSVGPYYGCGFANDNYQSDRALYWGATAAAM